MVHSSALHLAALALAPSVALSQPAPAAPEPWTTGDWYGGGASALVGSAVLIGAGYALGLGAEHLLEIDTSILRGTGSGLGAMFGPSLGIGVYGALRGHEGFAGGVAGSMICLVGTTAIFYGFADRDDPAVWPLFAIGATLPVCATLGYGWQAQHRADEAARQAVLPLTTRAPNGEAVLGLQWVGAIF